jgi:hypothetical protein
MTNKKYTIKVFHLLSKNAFKIFSIHFFNFDAGYTNQRWHYAQDGR